MNGRVFVVGVSALLWLMPLAPISPTASRPSPPNSAETGLVRTAAALIQPVRLTRTAQARPLSDTARGGLDVLPRRKPAPPERLMPTAHAAAFRDAFDHARAGRLTRARAAVAGLDYPALQTALTWMALRRAFAADFDTYQGFLANHPDWPSRNRILASAEAMVDGRVPLDQRLAWFGAHPPQTGRGRLAYAEALFEAGRPDDATPYLKAGWHSAPLTGAAQRRILARWGDRLSPADHQQRAHYWLWQRNRSQAYRISGQLSPDQRKLVQARLALIGFAPGVDARIAAVPEALLDHAGLVYDRAYWRRVKGKDDSARDLLLSADVDGADILRPSRWWQERHYQARQELKAGRYDTAYRLAAEHKLYGAIAPQTEIETLPEIDSTDVPRRLRAQIAEAEFLAGWLALRFLDRPGQAMDHFRRVYDMVNFPVSIARAGYWTGRAAEARGDPVSASLWYQRAAEHGAFFYGQLAASRLGQWPALANDGEAPVTDRDRAAFKADARVQAARYLAHLDEQVALRLLLSHMVETAATPGLRRLYLDLGPAIDRPDASLAAAKRLARTGRLVLDAAYPVIDVPDRHRPRLPLILAITRQESAFNAGAVSHAGAMGLMQLTPPTANLVARRLNRPFDRQRLVYDPTYNLDLGAAHVRSLLERYDGSIVLALGAYNAGGRPVGRWIDTYGDPRKPGVDVVDWIETIPYSETRNYIQRVMEAAVVYHARLSPGDGAAVSLDEMLHYGRPNAARPTLMR
ncbi:soluble lytic murein transglycosylase [Rhodothalassium salexigens DSM 2132]|uniref:Soluble lytic murein transglycosylase n=1 Tax=Rhodothalassium salexigens DSM 2132 TaxID=1188247 RepID=A0A4R2PTJ5_RHOSA|nr:hypothetical protein [Rhodothalassium salexigens DSM 2132]TCP38454.1 soluble lytic murein transglycosylase [Rhodothalassium salexigens DSM 2132]